MGETTTVVVEEEEEELRQLRSRATELVLREDWREYIRLYTHLISHCLHHLSPSASATHEASASDQPGKTKLRKTLCGALSNRAEARLRLRDAPGALDDCDRALALDPSRPKTLVCKGKILLGLDRYSSAADCFRRAVAGGGASEATRVLLDRCRKLEAQSKTGAFDLSEWILNGFKGDAPDLAEYVGPVEIRRSEACGGGRGLFATRNIEAGTTLVVTKATVIGRGILPADQPTGSGDRALSWETGRLVMWKDFVERLLDAAGRCRRTLRLIYTLSAGENEGDLAVPDIRLFLPEQSPVPADGEEGGAHETFDTDRILKILDVNCLTEDAASAKVLGKHGCGGVGYHGVGLWILASFINHSCTPNARRLHVGDHVVIHASRDVKAGEEITFPYFDVLAPLSKRREAMAGTWGFCCQCCRCQFEEATTYAGEMRDIEAEVAAHGGATDMGEAAAKLEERMARRWMAKEKEKGFVRASFWAAYSAAYASERSMRKWERRLPVEAAAGESVAEASGGDERVLKVVVEGMKRRRRKKGGGEAEVEMVTRMARGVYGKVAKKHAAMRALLDLAN